MDTHESSTTCLSTDEHAEALAAWRSLQAALGPLDAMLDQGEAIDCNDLQRAFLRAATAFDAFERTIMRAQQFRLLLANEHRNTTA